MVEPEEVGMYGDDSAEAAVRPLGAEAEAADTAAEAVRMTAATAEPMRREPAADLSIPESTRSKSLARTTDKVK